MSAPLSVTPCSSNRPVSTTEGAIATSVLGDAVDMEVNRDASVGVILEVFAADPIARVSDGDGTGDDPDIPTRALGNVCDAIVADDVNQDGDALGIDVVGMLGDI